MDEDRDGKDTLHRFHIADANTRGVIVRIDEAWREIQSRAEYPPPVSRMLGECLAASALFAGDLKMAGSISIQVKSPSAVKVIYAECTAEGELRAIAQWDEVDRLPTDIQSLGERSIIAITIEKAHNPTRYQGLVPLQGDSFAQAFSAYFIQSEQLPTQLMLATTPSQCSGMLLQQIPSLGGHEIREVSADFGRLSMLFNTLSPEELLGLSSSEILRRLFSEENVTLHTPVGLKFGCRCSREKVVNVLLALGKEEVEEALAKEGIIEVRCEFCNSRYAFASEEMRYLFAESRQIPGSGRVQ